MADEKLVEIIIRPIHENEIFDCYDTLVLSGGSVKGICSLGAVQWLFDNFYMDKIKNYVGTSVGSIICYLLIIGYTPIEVIAIVCSKRIIERMNYFNVNEAMDGRGAMSFSIMQEELEKMTLDKIGTLFTMKSLYEKTGKNMACGVFNLTQNKTEYISVDTYPDIPCITAIKMSCNIPLVFGELKYKDNYYIDGGITCNFPFDYAKTISNNIIGINIISEYEFKPLSETNIIEYIYKLLWISTQNNSKIQSSESTHKIINLNVSQISSYTVDMTTKQKLDLFSNGYNQISQQFYI